MANYKFTESDFEYATLIWLEGLGYTVGHVPETRDVLLPDLISDELRVGEV